MSMVKVAKMVPLKEYYVGVYQDMSGTYRVLGPDNNWIGSSGQHVCASKGVMEDILVAANKFRSHAQAVLISCVLLNDGTIRAEAHKLVGH